MTLTHPTSFDERAVAQLRRSFTGPVVTPADDGYDTVRKVWNGSIDRAPVVIARCADANDAATAIRVAREADLAIAVRGGGHSFPGYSTCDDGLVVDLSRMRAIRVDSEAATVTVK